MMCGQGCGLIENKKGSSPNEWTAFRLLSKFPKPLFWRNLYKTASEIGVDELPLVNEVP